MVRNTLLKQTFNLYLLIPSYQYTRWPTVNDYFCNGVISTSLSCPKSGMCLFLPPNLSHCSEPWQRNTLKDKIQGKFENTGSCIIHACSTLGKKKCERILWHYNEGIKGQQTVGVLEREQHDSWRSKWFTVYLSYCASLMMCLPLVWYLFHLSYYFYFLHSPCGALTISLCI